jgi:hypothetical protein
MVSAISSCAHFESTSFSRSQLFEERQRSMAGVLDSRNRVVGDAGEHVRQISFRIDAVQFGGTNQRVHRRGDYSPLRRFRGPFSVQRSLRRRKALLRQRGITST